MSIECMQQTHDQKTKLSYLGQIHFSHFSNIGDDPWEVANDENRDDDDRNPCQANVPFTQSVRRCRSSDVSPYGSVVRVRIWSNVPFQSPVDHNVKRDEDKHWTKLRYQKTEVVHVDLHCKL